MAIEKREKEFEQAYEEWEKNQYKKSLNSISTGGKKDLPKDKCSLF